MSRERRLDLAKFDAMAADLHLMIDAPDVVQAPVRAPARQIAGAVQPPPAAPNGSGTNRSAVRSGRPR